MPPRHLPFALILCRHSEFPPFLWLTSLPLRAASSSPHIAIVIHLALINLRRGKAECCRKGQFPRCGNLTFTAAILPRNGVAPWGRVCIFREGERGRGKNERQRGGGCAKPLRGQAPVTPKRLLHSRFASATHYKTEIFVDGTRADAVDLPDMQIFKARF